MQVKFSVNLHSWVFNNSVHGREESFFFFPGNRNNPDLLILNLSLFLFLIKYDIMNVYGMVEVELH
jgi:hypothetical protein